MSFRVGERAEADIAEIARYIAADNPTAAIRWHDDIYRHFENLGQIPGQGVSRDSLRRGMMLFPVGKYLILYRKIVDGIEIVRVVHGARDLRKIV